ncbi:carbamate kinase [Gemmatimonadota bacterium]
MSQSDGLLVVALGGNAITRQNDTGAIPEQFVNTRESLAPIADEVVRGRQVVITHGNGPQVGNYLIRVERAQSEVPYLPLPIIVADLQGGMGYMISQVMQRLLQEKESLHPVTTVLTQVLIDADDPSLTDPTKYVGPFYSEDEARELAATRGWSVKADSNRGWRRVVPSPLPVEIIEAGIIRQLIDNGTVVIAAGGGGIPVRRTGGGFLEGVDGVIDKDRASAVLALDIGASELLILTSVPCVSLDFGTPEQRDLEHLTLAEAMRYSEEGHFPPGNMGPKIESALWFLERGGERVYIGAVDQAGAILAGKSGTIISPT